MSYAPRRPIGFPHDRQIGPGTPTPTLASTPASTAEPPTVPARTDAELAHDALRGTLLGLGAESAWDTSDRAPGAPGVDPWADDDRSFGRLYADQATLDFDEQSARGARALVHDQVFAAVVRYAQALRREGIALPTALVAVRATVREGSVLLGPAASAAVQRDAARCCLEAYYAH